MKNTDYNGHFSRRVYSTVNYASANSYEIRSNIFNGGYTVYSGGSAEAMYPTYSLVVGR